MKYIISIIIILVAFACTFFYGVHVGTMETERSYFKQAVGLDIETKKDNEKAKENFNDFEDYKGIWKDLCGKQ